MNTKVVSASKKSESAFESAHSISSISKDEIQKAGITSIPEALRLIPGTIVRENTNGNYDVQIRGLDGLAPATALDNASNSITLVMIDNRPVYNYFNGGIFWETLPIDINDIERIEVVRGASSALYGPNAAAGVINIITKQLTKEGISIQANVQKGVIPSSIITNTSIGFKKEKFNITISGNYQKRDRTESNYYDWVQDKKVSADSIKSYYPGGLLTNLNGTPNAHERYPYPSRAQDKFGYNLFLGYDFDLNKKNFATLVIGGQNSFVQKAFSENLASPITSMESQSNYIDGKIKYGNLNLLIADQFGKQYISRGMPAYQFDFNTFDAIVEYDFKINNLTIRPGINFRNAIYDDSKYSNISKNEGFINGKKSLLNIAGSIRAEFNPNDNIKLITALRTDKYNYPDEIYNSYQFALSYKITNNNILRAVLSRSYRGPTIYDIYSTREVFAGKSPDSATLDLPRYATLTGNKNISLQKIDLYEIGYRTKITDNLIFESDVFYQKSNDFLQPISGDNIVIGKTRVDIPQTIENIPLEAHQIGITLASTYIINKLQFKPFVTFQKTNLYNVSRYRKSQSADSINNFNVLYDTINAATPTIFGGFYLNYQFSKKINLNLSAYYFSQQSYNNLFSNYDQDFGLKNGIVTIKGKFILNAKISFKPVEKFEVFLNIKNALNQTSYEFAHTDKTQLNLLVGVSFNY